MAAKNGRNSNYLIKQLLENGHTLDFFQAVRILQQLANNNETAESHCAHGFVGYDHWPQQESINFSVSSQLHFPTTDVEHIQKTTAESPELNDAYALRVNFIGLVGTQGVLPHFYNQRLTERLSKKDTALRDYFDLFHQRTISFFYRAWEKYQFPLNFERAYFSEHTVNPFVTLLYALAGIDPQIGASTQKIPQPLLFQYSGHFSHRPRNAQGLVSVLKDYFQVSVEIKYFQGQWLILQDNERTRLTRSKNAEKYYARLGKDTFLGKKIWHVQSKFSLLLGPLDYKQFLQFLPCSQTFYAFVSAVRLYVGLELHFELYLVVKNEQIPQCQLGKTSAYESRLGWNTWVGKVKHTTKVQTVKLRKELVECGYLFKEEKRAC